MKTNSYKSFILLAVVSLFAFKLGAQRIEKEVEETFPASASTILDVESKFGNVEIVNWDRDEVKVKAVMWVESKRESYAEDLLDKMDVEIYSEGDQISVKSVYFQPT
jgi:hypothetical protein